ncbi:hypothetical protein ACHAP7_008641 [Fusarium lateritium]
MTTIPKPTKNFGLYANEEGKIIAHDVPFPDPEQGGLLIKVLYSGVNLSDVRTLAFFGLKNYGIGNEFSGEVLDSPDLTSTPFKAGDIVAGCVGGSNTRLSRHATYRQYITAKPEWLFKVPDNTPPGAAAGLTVVVLTGADALYNRFHLPLPQSVARGTPDEDAATPQGTLVVWGGATGVGMSAIQLARASRVSSIVAIASEKRHEYLKMLGATQCFDYKDPNVVENVKLSLQGTTGTIWGFDALGSVDNPVSQDILKNAIPPNHDVKLVTVLLSPHKDFDICTGGRNFDIDFDLPDGTKILLPKDKVAADRDWRALRWAVNNYGSDFVLPIQVFEGSGEGAINELNKTWEMSAFGKVVLKHPLSK